MRSQAVAQMTLLEAAVRGESTRRAPIWIMRQAGRYLPEYRAIKQRATFLEMTRDPALAAEITLQPLRRFPLDAAIVFSDIMTPLEALGIEIAFTPGPSIAARCVRARRSTRSCSVTRSLRSSARRCAWCARRFRRDRAHRLRRGAADARRLPRRRRREQGVRAVPAVLARRARRDARAAREAHGAHDSRMCGCKSRRAPA